MGEKVLVTGGAGFIGSNIVDKLLIEEYEVSVIDNLSSGEIHNLCIDTVDFYNIDIRNYEQVYKVVGTIRPDYIIHQAAQVSVAESIRNITSDEEINIRGSINIIEAARLFDVKKVVFASTAAVYGNPQYLPIDEQHPITPMSPYGISKYAGEQYLSLAYKLYGLQYTILRYSNVYGLRQKATGEGGVVSKFVDAAKNDSPITIYGDGTQTRDFIYVKDVADANIKALKYGANNTFNISSGLPVSINELVICIEDIFSKKLEKINCDVRSGDIKDSLLLNEKARKELNWSNNVNLYEGLKNMFSLIYA